MYFLIGIAAALVGIGMLLYGAKPKPEAYYQPIIDTDRWIESWEIALQKALRKVLRFIVVHLVGWYRFVIHDITIHKTMKKKVRELLYEHHHEQRKSSKLESTFANKDE